MNKIISIGIYLRNRDQGSGLGCPRLKVEDMPTQPKAQYSLRRKYTCSKAKYSQSRGAKGKVGGVPHPPLSWPSLDQLNGGFGASPTFHLPPPPSVLSTWLNKSVYFLLGETVRPRDGLSGLKQDPGPVVQ